MKRTIEEKLQLTVGKKMWYTQDLNGTLESIMMCDGPHGLRKQDVGSISNNDSVLATCFPTASGSASTWNPDLIMKMSSSIAKEAHNENVSMLLGPGINMKRSPLCGRNFEYFSEDPFLAGTLGTAFVKGVEEMGIGTSLKHFAANSQETIRMTSNSMVDERALREIYLKAFEMVVKEAKPATLMASYNRINGLYASENPWLLTDVLRKDWGFKGAVVSDWGACTDLTASLKAGMDLEMPDSNGIHYEKTLKDFQKGKISEEEIERAYRNVLHLVEKYQVTHREKKDKYDVSGNHQVAIEVAEEAAVLLENDGVLPLKPQEIILIGGLAEEVRFQGGGSSHIHTNKVLGAKEALTNLGYQVTYLEGYSPSTMERHPKLEEEAIALAKKNLPILFFGGLTDMTEGEGYDRSTLAMPENQSHLLQELAKVNSNIIFISFGGAPYDICFQKECRAILHMYLSGEGVMEAMANLVSGKVNPSGRLAETYPMKIEDTPAYGNYATGSMDIAYKESIFIGYRYYDTFQVPVRYPFGYGKSYTTFSYSDLKVEGDTVSFKIKNTGKLPGKEVAQVYVGRTSKDYLHAKKELKGFQKVFLAPDEEQTVVIPLPDTAYQVYDKEKGWIIPKGEAIISVGQSVEDIVLSAVIQKEGIDYKKSYSSVYGNLENKLKNISDEEFASIYQMEMSHYDHMKPGDFELSNNLVELSKHSKIAKKLLKGIKEGMLENIYKGRSMDDPEVIMMVETVETGRLDAVMVMTGKQVPYRLAEAAVLEANGHKIRAFFKAIFG